MTRLTSTLAALALFTQSINGQASLCEYFGGSPLQCQICGYNPRAPVYCVAYNATFDDLAASNSIPTYKNTAWPGFSVIGESPITGAVSRIQKTTKTRRNPKKPSSKSSTKVARAAAVLSPYSAPNYAAIAPGTVGTMQFGQEGGVDPVATNGQLPSGSLHSFHYACAIPNTNPPIPTACTVTVQGSCVVTGSGNFVEGPFNPLTVTLSYDPSLLDVTQSMAFQPADFAYTGADQDVSTPQKCSNYSFSAVGTVTPLNTAIGQGGNADLSAVTLLLDDIIYNTFAKGLR